MVSSRKFWRFGLFSLVFLLVVLIASLSRGAMIHAGISLFLMMIVLLIHGRSARPTFLTFIGLCVLVCVVALTLMDQITAALDNSLMGQRMSLQSYDDTRFSNVADAANRVLENPLGIGQGQSRYLYGYLPHNTFVAFALQNGIAASLGLLLIYLAAMGRCLVKVLDKQPGWTKYAFVLSILCGLLVLMQVVGSSHWRHLYIVCGLAFGNYRTDAPTDTGEQWRPSYMRRMSARPGLLYRLLTPERDRHV
nr:O-antigen ligase family protein [Salipiger sp. PrR002]